MKRWKRIPSVYLISPPRCCCFISPHPHPHKPTLTPTNTYLDPNIIPHITKAYMTYPREAILHVLNKQNNHLAPQCQEK